MGLSQWSTAAAVGLGELEIAAAAPKAWTPSGRLLGGWAPSYWPSASPAPADAALEGRLKSGVSRGLQDPQGEVRQLSVFPPASICEILNTSTEV